MKSIQIDAKEAKALWGKLRHMAQDADLVINRRSQPSFVVMRHDRYVEMKRSAAASTGGLDQLTSEFEARVQAMQGRAHQRAVAKLMDIGEGDLHAALKASQQPPARNTGRSVVAGSIRRPVGVNAKKHTGETIKNTPKKPPNKTPRALKKTA